MASRIHHGLVASILAVTAACGATSNSSPPTTNHDTPDASTPTVDAGASNDSAADAAPTPGDPFAPQPDTSEGLVNVSSDLDAVLERGALADACAKYRATPADRHAKLLCGKAMFFYEGFGNTGVPAALVQFLIDHFPNEIGPGFSKLGMVPDPRSTSHLPLGLAPGKKLGTADTYAFTCASCHFAKLSDGRYAVGAPNHGYRYGDMNLAFTVFTGIASGTSQPSAHDPDAVAKVQPLLDRVNADASLKLTLLQALLPLLGAQMPVFPPETEHLYASWKTGTMDFLIAPLPFDDHVHTISKISALWGIPSVAETKSSGMTNAMLGFTGVATATMHFLEGFVALGGGTLSDWPDSSLEPLAEYIESLRAPAPPTAPDATLVARGETLFRDKGCLKCHGGPRGSGLELYTYEEIGTDAAMKRWCDPNLTGTPPAPIVFPSNDKVTHAIKSPRLNGMWAMTRFLHNGSVDTLGDLFCTSRPRGDVTALAYGNGGHAMTCDGLSPDEKTALIAYLMAH